MYINICLSCCWVAKSGPTLCNPMGCSLPLFPLFQYLPEFAQTHVHWIGDVIQPSHPLSSPSCPQSFPASGSFPMSWLFASGSQRIGASASVSVPPTNTQGWFPLGLTGWISLQSKGLSRVFSSSTIQKHQFFSAQPSLWSNSHDYWKNYSFDFMDLCWQNQQPGRPITVPQFHLALWRIYSQFSSVAQSCPTLCDPMNHGTPGLPVLHHLLEFAQTRVHWVGDAIQPSHPLSSPSLSAFSLFQHQGLFQRVSTLHQVDKVLEL